MTTQRINILFIIITLLLAACGGSAQWAEFAPNDGGFAVLIPGTPQDQSQAVPTAAGDIQMHLFTLEGGPTEYAVGYFDLPAELLGLVDAESLISSGIDGFFSGLGGASNGHNSITLNGYPGLEATGSFSEGGRNGLMRGRFYMVDERIFAAFAAYEEGNAADVDKFLSSFRLTTAAAAVEPAAEPTEAAAAPVESPTQPAQAAATSVPVAQPLPAGELGVSRSNPFSRSEVAAAPNWDVRVLEVVRGDAAWQIVQSTNPFNDPAPAGMEYLLVKLQVKSTYTDNAAHSISGGDFDVTGDRRIAYSQALAVAPDPQLDASLMPGGEAEGWTIHLVGQGEGNLLLIVNELENFDDNRYRYIALDEGAAVVTDGALDAIAPTDAGTDVSSPAAQSETVIAEDWEISVLEVIRGDAAWDRLLAASEINDPVPAGMEYVLVRGRVRNISIEEIAERVDAFNFTSTGSAGVLYDTPIMINPEPELQASLYPGGQIEGWFTLQVAQGETGIVLIFEQLFDLEGVNTRYIALE